MLKTQCKIFKLFVPLYLIHHWLLIGITINYCGIIAKVTFYGWKMKCLQQILKLDVICKKKKIFAKYYFSHCLVEIIPRGNNTNTRPLCLLFAIFLVAFVAFKELHVCCQILIVQKSMCKFWVVFGISSICLQTIPDCYFVVVLERTVP